MAAIAVLNRSGAGVRVANADQCSVSCGWLYEQADLLPEITDSATACDRTLIPQCDAPSTSPYAIVSM